MLLAAAVWLVLEPVGSGLLALAGPAALSASILWLRRGPAGPRTVRTAVVASPFAMDALVEELGRRSGSPYVLVGRIAADRHGADGGALGPVGEIEEIVRRHRVDLVLLARDAPRIAVLEALGAEVDRSDVRVMDLSAFYERVLGYVPLSDASAAWLSYILHPGYRRGSSAHQRAFDVVTAMAIGIVFLPVLLVAALLVKLDGGPVFFRQIRIGERGRPISVLKLRTMRTSAEPTNEWCRPGDPRITPVGRWLRRLHLDELPQLVSVLRGDMRMVGPRPEQPHYVEQLESALPFYSRRHLLKPGLTGWAQVRCGYAGSDGGSAWKLCHDLYYLKHQSLRFDIAILLQTARVVCGRGDVASTHVASGALPALAPASRPGREPEALSETLPLPAS